MVMFTCLLSRLCQRDKFLYLVLLLLLQLILKIKPRINALVIKLLRWNCFIFFVRFDCQEIIYSSRTLPDFGAHLRSLEVSKPDRKVTTTRFVACKERYSALSLDN